MKNKSIVFLMCVALLVIAMPLASAEDSPSMYFVPDGGNGNCGETTQVDLMLNHSVVVTGVQAQINFDTACINITDVDFTGCPWQPLVQPGWGHYVDNIRLAAMDASGVFPPGPHKIATLTIECVSDSNCTSDIELTDTEPEGYTLYNTTFTCNDAEEPDVTTISIGSGDGIVTIPIVVTNATNVGSCHIMLDYDTSVVSIAGLSNGDMEEFITNTEHTSEGWIGFAAFQINNSGLSGDFTLLNVDFEPVGNISSCQLGISVITFKDATPDTCSIDHIVVNGTYTSSLNGDVDDNGVVDIADAMLIAKYVVGLAGYENINEEAADVTGDGIIDIADAMYLAKHVVGIAGFEELR